MVRFVVYAVTLCVIYSVIDRLSHKGISKNADSSSYIVKTPKALSYVYVVFFLMGLLLFVVFIIFKLKGNPSITTGDFVFALIFSVIGLFVMTWASRWHVIAKNGTLEIHRMFHRTTTVQITDLDHAEIGKKTELVLYLSGEKLITIDCLCDNYDLLIKDLKREGKIK